MKNRLPKFVIGILIALCTSIFIAGLLGFAHIYFTKYVLISGKSTIPKNLVSDFLKSTHGNLESIQLTDYKIDDEEHVWTYYCKDKDGLLYYVYFHHPKYNEFGSKYTRFDDRYVPPVCIEDGYWAARIIRDNPDLRSYWDRTSPCIFTFDLNNSDNIQRDIDYAIYAMCYLKNNGTVDEYVNLKHYIIRFYHDGFWQSDITLTPDDFYGDDQKIADFIHNALGY